VLFTLLHFIFVVLCSLSIRWSVCTTLQPQASHCGMWSWCWNIVLHICHLRAGISILQSCALIYQFLEDVHPFCFNSLMKVFWVWELCFWMHLQNLKLEWLLMIFRCFSELPTWLICFIVHSSHWNFILWFCTLEHLLLTPIVILILCYHQNLLSTRRLLSDPLCSNTPTSLLHHQRDSIMAEWKIWIQPPNAIFSNQAAQS
jgi:hypothetical protein